MPSGLIDRVTIYVDSEKNFELVLHLLLSMKSQVSLMKFDLNKQESTISQYREVNLKGYIYAYRGMFLQDKQFFNRRV
jgi:hypothetical protein